MSISLNSVTRNDTPDLVTRVLSLSVSTLHDDEADITVVNAASEADDNVTLLQVHAGGALDNYNATPNLESGYSLSGRKTIASAATTGAPATDFFGDVDALEMEDFFRSFGANIESADITFTFGFDSMWGNLLYAGDPFGVLDATPIITMPDFFTTPDALSTTDFFSAPAPQATTDFFGAGTSVTFDDFFE